jgi:RHS repeat-associated protein
VARTNANRVESDRTQYEPYGRAHSGGVPEGLELGFTGHVNDTETGLTYMQQRYYEPLAGRFLSADPVTTSFKNGDLFNRYSYAYNNPYRFKDPDGRFGIPGALAGAAIEAIAQYAVTGSVSDYKAIAVAAAVGAVTGGVGSYAAKAAMTGATTAGKAVVATAAAGGAAAAAGKHAEAALKGETASAKDVGIAAAGGAAGAGAAGAIANGAAGALGKAAASSDGVVSGIAAATRSAISGGGGAVQIGNSTLNQAGQKSAETAAAVVQKTGEEKLK